MRNPSIFFVVVVMMLFSLGCFSGCITQNGGITGNIPPTTIITQHSGITETTQSPVIGEPAYQQERISTQVRTGIMESVSAIPYVDMDENEKDLCVRSDSRDLVTTVLKDPNAQDMLMKDGRITGIWPYLPRSAKTNPDAGDCTAAVYIHSRNITSVFVVDQEKQIVSLQVIEVLPGTHVTELGNRTLVSVNESLVFSFCKEHYYS